MNKMQNRLSRLLALNRAAPRAYKIEAAETQGEATIYFYDVIGYDWWTDGGITAKQFSKDLVALGSQTLNLRVNSPGGDVFEGRAIVAALQAYPGKVIAHVDGLAASAASFIVMHADEVVMTDGSFMMIHNGWTMAVGDRHTLLDTAALLEKIDASIVDDYKRRATPDAKQIAAWMDAETWLSAAEAVEYGFADRIADAGGSKGKASAKAWNLGAYDNAPAELAAADPEAAPEEIEPAPEPTAAPAPDPEIEAAHAHRLRMLALVDRHPA